MNGQTIASGTMQMDPQTAMMASRQAPKVHAGMNREQARKAAEDFEAFFISQSFETMFQGIDTAPPFGGGNAEKMWRSMEIQEYGKEIAKNGGVGIADAVFREMINMQEVKR